jgi:carbamoyltransferase
MSSIIKDITSIEIAKIIADKNIVALFQGQSEAGHRALGNRSILYDPRDPNGKDYVNVVKQREGFRPFAASVMLESTHDWFDMRGLNESPFMMFAVDVKEDKKKLIPCVTHVDGTCRIQTVTQKQNSHFYNLISAFNDLTNVPMLFNTSFNLAGEVIVETELDAIDVLKRSKIEYLYLPEKQQLIIEKNI